MAERDDLGSDRQLPAGIPGETPDAEDFNRLAIRIKEQERKNWELGESMIRGLPERPKTHHADSAVGE